MAAPAPVNISDVFTWHKLDQTNGSLLKDYDITKVESASVSRGTTQLRTLVVFAKHRKFPSLALAIKITPIYLNSRREDFVREQQIHYLLTQLDAAVVREATRESNAKIKTDSLFRVKKGENPLTHEDAVATAIATANDDNNVVPLYDFVIQQFDLRTIPNIPGRELLNPITWLNPHTASIMVQRQLDGTLTTLLEKTTDLGVIVKQLRYVIIQMCCILHSLLAIGFTHGDTHPNNIGWATAAYERHYFIASDKVFVIPPDVPTAVLLDFDTSRAEMTDATNKPFNMVPSRTSLYNRFSGVVTIVPAQTFSPMVDIFRLVHSVALMVAARMNDDRTNWPDGLTQSIEMRDLGQVCLTGITKLPESIMNLDSYKPVKAFCEEMMKPGRDKLSLKEEAKKLTANKDQATLWYLLYAATPSNKADAATFRMPLDVLLTQTSVRRAPAGSVNMTLAPLYKKGVVYQPQKVAYSDDPKMRIHPLTTAFPNEFGP